MDKLAVEQVTTNAVTLTWEQRETKPSYSFVVQASNDSIFLNETVNVTTYNIRGLTPGSPYNFTVISQTADGTRATPATTSSYTGMSLANMLKLTPNSMRQISLQAYSLMFPPLHFDRT